MWEYLPYFNDYYQFYFLPKNKNQMKKTNFNPYGVHVERIERTCLIKEPTTTTKKETKYKEKGKYSCIAYIMGVVNHEKHSRSVMCIDRHDLIKWK